MGTKSIRLIARHGPALVLGVYGGRVLGEWIAIQSGDVVGGLSVVAAISVTVLLAAAAVYGLRRKGPGQTWPLLFLGLYLISPVLDPERAVVAGALTGSALFLSSLPANRFVGTRTARVTLFGAVLVLLFVTLYLLTVAPGILPADSGELQLVAANLGVAHPPGFPLYTLLGNLFTRLPFGSSPALEVSLLSVVSSSLSLLVVYITVVGLTGRSIAAVVAVAALGSSTTFWSQATTANIRSLTGLFTALALMSVLRFARAASASKGIAGASKGSQPVGRQDSPSRWLTILALVLTSGIMHHGSLLFIGLVVVVFVLHTQPDLLKRPKAWIAPGAAVLVSLIPIIYLPWRAAELAKGIAVRGASSELLTFDGLMSHLLASGFRGDLFYYRDPAILWERLKVMVNVLEFQFEPVLLAGMGVGVLILWIRDRKLALLLGGSFTVHLLVTASYRAPQTVEYMLPAYILMALTLGYGAGYLETFVGRWIPSAAPAAGHAFAAMLLIGSAVQTVDRYPSFRHLHQQTDARDYAQLLLDQAPGEATILADWHWATPLWYLQEVEGLRPELSVQFVFPTAEPYAQTWSRRIAEALEQGSPVVATHYDEFAYASLPNPEPLGEALLFAQEPRRALPHDFVPLTLTFGDAVNVLGYSLDKSATEIGQPALLTLAWQPVDTAPSSLTLFAHLVGPDGQIYAQDDPKASPRPSGITLTQFRLTPRLGATPGEYEILIGAYAPDPLLDDVGQSRTQVTTLSVSAMSRPVYTGNPTSLPLASEQPARRLVGYDWDHTFPSDVRLYLHWRTKEGYRTEVRDGMDNNGLSLPAYVGPWGVTVSGRTISADGSTNYVPFGEGIVWTGPTLEDGDRLKPGATIGLRQTFQASRPITRDFATSVRLVGYETESVLWDWWYLDDEFGVPAMGGMPTLKWIAGSTVRDYHLLTVDASAYSGQPAGLILGLHDTFTNRPLPILDERFSRETPWQLTSISR